MTPAAAVLLALATASADAPTTMPPASAFAALGGDAVQDLIILGEARPILLRIRVMVGDRPFRAAWAESARSLHAQLDGDHDGRLTVEEAEKNGLGLYLVQPAAGRPRVEPDASPKDGAISVEELTEALRATSGPFRFQLDGPAERRTDALFDHLDRDKDGQFGRPELASIAGSLRQLDRDADELIDAGEVDLIATSAAPAMSGRPAREPAPPAVLEWGPGESPVRVARSLVKRYDAGSSRGPGRRDSKLSAEEFGISPAAFAAADTGGDGTLSVEEVRAYLAVAPPDATLDVALPADASGPALARLRDLDGANPSGISVRQLAEAIVEIDVGLLRIDIHVDGGQGAAEAARKGLRARFDAADANQDGYLVEDELTQDDGQPSPLAGPFKALDRDGDGKLYPRELDEYVAKQADAARARLSLTAADQGRALFGLLDTDRDGRLGAREVLDSYARVSACDRDGDGRVDPAEVPHHVRLTLGRGDLSALLATPANPNLVVVASRASTAPQFTRPATGPAWFRKMDRNRDGDVSRREFLGTRGQFDRLDRDHDGLLAPAEAEAAGPARGPGG